MLENDQFCTTYFGRFKSNPAFAFGSSSRSSKPDAGLERDRISRDPPCRISSGSHSYIPAQVFVLSNDVVMIDAESQLPRAGIGGRTAARLRRKSGTPSTTGDNSNTESPALRSKFGLLHRDLLHRDQLPTPTTTVKEEPVCPCWDLHQAAASEEGGEAVRRFIVSGGDPRAEQWGNSPLHVAAHNGNEEVLTIALSNGADVEQRNRAEETALHLACRGAHAGAVRLLLESAADPSVVDICGRTPIQLCARQKSSREIIELLGRSEELRGVGAFKRKVHVQVCHDNLRGVEKLLSGGGSIDFRDNAQRTLLHRACEEASVKTVAKLLELGATVDATEKRGQTPLHRACERGRLGVVRLLVEQGQADTRAVAKLKHEPLHVACLGNWGSVVSYLLGEGRAGVEAPDKNGKRPLHLAVESNKLESIRELLKHGCDIEAPLSDGVTRPLHVACRKGYEKAAILLLDRGARVSTAGADGLHPLHTAAKEGKASIVELLIGRKANLRAKDNRGRSPLQSTNNRRCKERLREAERKEERLEQERKMQEKERKRTLALKRREEELLGRVDMRTRARLSPVLPYG